MDQSAIIHSAQHGNLDSFNQLVLTYQDRMFNVAAYMLDSEDCAADAVQNAFVLAFRNIRGYNGGSFEFWLLRILRNVCYDEMRRKKRQWTCPLEPLIDEKEFDSPIWVVDHSQNMDDLIDNVELSDAIRSHLQMLKPEYRMVITLVDIDGMEYAAAAQILDIPVGTVKSRLARARFQMRHELQRCADLLPDTYIRSRSMFMPRTVAVG
jgi:RNA polymerase sigma factor (sigma-70 family)